MTVTFSLGRSRRLAVGIAVVLAAAVVWVWRAGVFSPTATSVGGQGAKAPATAPVVREDLLATTPVGGTLTWLPQPGQVIAQGQALYRVDDGSPVVLLYGNVPDWRAMSAGTTGADVSQLNHDLAAMRDVAGSDIAATGWDYYSRATASGVQRLEERLGVSGPAGSVSLGQAVFEPQPIRVTQVSGSLGSPAAGPVLQATSSMHVVMVALDVSLESEVKLGDGVSVTLPDGATTP